MWILQIFCGWILGFFIIPRFTLSFRGMVRDFFTEGPKSLIASYMISLPLLIYKAMIPAVILSSSLWTTALVISVPATLSFVWRFLCERALHRKYFMVFESLKGPLRDLNKAAGVKDYKDPVNPFS
ncbi:MAG: hypothetical protein WDZ70_02740 [Candidatus Paceibacterota bacterium]